MSVRSVGRGVLEGCALRSGLGVLTGWVLGVAFTAGVELGVARSEGVGFAEGVAKTPGVAFTDSIERGVDAG